MRARRYNHALITGGAGGLGKAMAACFLREGYRVTLVDHRREALEQVRRELPAATGFQVDMTDTAALRSLVEQLGSSPDGPDVIVNSAGVHYARPLTSQDYDLCDQIDDIEREIRTNLIALVQHCALWRPFLMRRKTGAAIVNIASALSFVPKYSSAVYCATKAAVHQFSRVFALQLEHSGIQVVTVYPPMVATPMTAGRNERAMPAEDFAGRFYRAFQKGRNQIQIGETKWLCLANRLSPAFAARFIERD